MEKKVIIGHAKGEDEKAERLAKALRAQGCEVVHRGTLLVGDSYQREFDACLSAGLPVVFCGTTRAAGSTWAMALVHKANSLGIQVFPVRMDEDAFMRHIFHDEMVIADCTGTKFQVGVSELNRSLEKYFSAVDPYSSVGAVDVDRPATYLDELTRETAFDRDEVTAYRERLRPEIRMKYPASRTQKNFLSDMGFLVGNKLTLLGLMLFRNLPSKYYMRPIVKCSLYNGSDQSETASKKADYDEPLHKQFDLALNFILSNIDSREIHSHKKADLELIYKYPDECLGEILANALCHRDYKLSGRDIQVRIYNDRIEIASPGMWVGDELTDGKKYVLSDLKKEADQRNPRLARALYAIKLSEGRAEGIRKSVRNCIETRARIPTVVQRGETVYVTIFPRQDWDQVDGAADEKKKIKTRSSMGNLRAVVKKNKTCAKLFEEAEMLAKSIFNDSQNVPLPYYTVHGEENCKAIEDYLNKIIWDAKHEPTKSDFIPSPEEAMYLLSAVWLHDIGMMYGIFQEEQASDLANNPNYCAKLRNEHEVRTARHLWNEWNLECRWTTDEKAFLANICHYHRKKHNIEEFAPKVINGEISGKPIRIKVIAALLRIADACHIDRSRVPGNLRALYDSLTMPPEEVCFWDQPELVSNVRFQHTDGKIIIESLVPKPIDFKWGKFDFGEIIELVRKDIEEELKSVQTVLLSYTNTAFKEVTKEVNILPSLDVETPRRCLGVWPYFLKKSYSATEGAASLVQMLLFEIAETQHFGEPWRIRIRGMMREVMQWRPYDVVVFKLRNEINEILSQAQPGSPVQNRLNVYLGEFLESICAKCEKMTKRAKSLVKPEDVLFLYGYSINIVKFLQAIKRSHSGTVYVVDCRSSKAHLQFDPHENEQIAAFLRKNGFDDHFIRLNELSQILDDLGRTNKMRKIILGTHSVLQKNDSDYNLLCKKGSKGLCLIGRDGGAKILAFAETNKFLDLRDEEDIESVAVQGFSYRQENGSVGVASGQKRLGIQMDVIPKSLIDYLITEEGIYQE